MQRTGEQWARALFEDAPLPARGRLVAGWLLLGLALGPPWSPGRVLGWTLRHSDRDFALLGAAGRLGTSAELLFRPRPGGLLFATFTHQANGAARAVWNRTVPLHQRVVGSMLEQAARREAASQ